MSEVRLGVIGWPVAHSRSPAMQNAALAELGLTDWRFQLLPVAPDVLGEAVRALPEAGFRGASVTIPHKEAVIDAVDDVGREARAIGAVNTLIIDQQGQIRGENTDAPGFIAALPEQPGPGATATVLGAGGSARAVVWALRNAGADVMVWNRTFSRAEELAAEFDAAPVEAPSGSDILVNCTAAGMDADPFADLPVTGEQLASYGVVVDLVYSGAGELIGAATEAGCRTVDGIDILVAQGALAFEMWTGLPAPVGVMEAAARSGADGGSSAT